MKQLSKIKQITGCILFFIILNGCVTATPPATDCAKLRFETHGAFGWNELITSNAMKAKDFYTELFGWSPSIMQKEYISFKNKEEKIAGVMEKKKQKPFWLPYVTVNDVDKTVEKAKRLGASILTPPTYAPDIGRFAILKDPQGAVIAVITYIRKN
ncbi:MAG: VOC family protein [Deltaproteobacteria bacterium]|nr:VOC family protein [Deltaproteobacteria bacterium]